MIARHPDGVISSSSNGGAPTNHDYDSELPSPSARYGLTVTQSNLAQQPSQPGLPTAATTIPAVANGTPTRANVLTMSPFSAWSDVPRVPPPMDLFNHPDDIAQTPDSATGLNHNVIISPYDLPFSLDRNLEVSTNPFQMTFADPKMEDEYVEWVHLRYIPSRFWLLFSAFIGDLDAMMFGVKSMTIHVLIMHIVAGLQVVAFVMMCLPALARFRRYLVYSLFFHVFFWTGMETSQTVAEKSSMHQNNFVVLPFYCAFICVVSAQVPVRHSVPLLCMLPMANALWRILMYYDLPSTSVLLVWWWLIGAFAYIFERMARQLFAWLQTAHAAEKTCAEQHAHTLTLLRALLPSTIIQHITRCATTAAAAIEAKATVIVSDNNTDTSPRTTSASDAATSRPSNQQLQKLLSLSKQESSNVIVIVSVGSTGREESTTDDESKESSHGEDPLASLSKMDAAADRHGFHRIAVFGHRCVYSASAEAGLSLENFCTSVLNIETLSHFTVLFSVCVSPSIAGLVISSQLCRYSVLSNGMQLAHGLASILERHPQRRNGHLILFRSMAEHIGLDLATSQSIKSSCCTELFAECSGCMADDLLLVSISAVGGNSSFGAWSGETSSASHLTDTSETVRILLSVLEQPSDDGEATSAETRLGPVPIIMWKTLFSWEGLRFADASHELNFRKFVIHAVPELIYMLCGCQLFCGLWTIVSFVAVLLPCHPTSLNGGIAPWVAAHVVLFALTCVVVRRLYIHLSRNRGRSLVAIKRASALLFILMFLHYGLSLGILHIQPSLVESGNWPDYVSSLTQGRSHYVEFDNQRCINVLYNMSYFLLFAIFFCIAAVPVFVCTTTRVLLELLLFAFHTILSCVLFHHIDYMEFGVLICILAVLLTVEGLVREFYRSLLVTNRCRLETEAMPEMQHRHDVMLASMPERVSSAPGLRYYHPFAGVLCIQFTTLDELMRDIVCLEKSRLEEIFADFVTLVSLVSDVLFQLSVSHSVVHLTMKNGSPGMVILLPPAMGATDESAFTEEFSLVAHAVGRGILRSSVHNLWFPPTFRMAAVVGAIEEHSVGGSYQIEGAVLDESERLLAGCLVNTISFNFKPPTLKTQPGLYASTSSHLDALTETRQGALLNSQSDSTMRESRIELVSFRPAQSPPSSSASASAGSPVFRRVRAKKRLPTIEPSSNNAVLQRSFVALVWATSTPTDAFTEQPSAPAEVHRFNRLYIRDVCSIFGHLKCRRVHAQFQQSTQHGFAVHILVEGHSPAQLAHSLCEMLFQPNKPTHCVGIGVHCGQFAPPTSFASCPYATHALYLAKLNTEHSLPDRAFGDPILVSAAALERAEYEFQTKPLLLAFGQPSIARLGRRIEAHANEEWMYELIGNNHDNPFAEYTVAFRQTVEGRIPQSPCSRHEKSSPNPNEPLALLAAYLAKHPTDLDAKRLLELATSSSQSGPEQKD